ncbi:uncharacterized protein NDAI_0G04380 [Naumovozyma dairenensis CBS 421]|uniref:Protein DOM34 homolog n=1 Tax=Naumovozyma dairenensis (strain ATCC 10597 / BCRC 20456 / CBS 421 / NBRC 0211 / NRRL Y-12639) TaxID=1071378 RepID=J7SAZ5_NAUDC|nr:hypothetical protein NDAI_0G04380 [Naumovozyma dairenensis CBS 421]CCK73423.1 hypothetical protein NDAI_0G04380 [Naumovozyma dairenensis CBS 421]
MKVVSINKGVTEKAPTVITLVPENKEDLFTVYQIVDKDDEVIFKKLFTSKNEDAKKNNTDLVNLKLKILSNEFDMRDEYLRYKGITVIDQTGVANIDIPIGKFLSFNIVYTHPITIYKHHFNKYAEKLLKEACAEENKSDTAAVVLQEGISHVCLLTSSSTIMKQKIEFTMPKKKSATDIAKFDVKTESFYKATYEAMKKNFDFDELKMIILCSPGFYAKTLLEKVLKYAEEEQNNSILDNQMIFFVAHCSTGYLQGISEVLKNPEYASKLEDTKFSKFAVIMDGFLKHLDDDDDRAWYGRREIFRACSMNAIETLLITDTKLRSDNIATREKYLDLLDDVEKDGGKVAIFSTLHTTGEELDRLSGLACILKYPIANLDEGFDSEDEGDNEEEDNEAKKQKLKEIETSA